jgi:hypothetical protein
MVGVRRLAVVLLVWASEILSNEQIYDEDAA